MMKFDAINKNSKPKIPSKQRSTLESVEADFISSQENTSRTQKAKDSKAGNEQKNDKTRWVWFLTSFGIIAVLGIWALSLQSNITRINQDNADSPEQSFQELELVRDRLQGLLSDTSDIFDNLNVATSSPATEEEPATDATETLSEEQIKSLIENLESSTTTEESSDNF